MFSDPSTDLKDLSTRCPTILIVDDEPDIRGELAEMFTDEGLHVVTAPDADSARAMVAANDAIGIVFTDLRMPGTGGMEFAAGLHERYVHKRALATVIITGHGGMDDAVGALNHGVSDFVTKPFEWERTREALDRAVGHWREAGESLRLAEHLHQTVESQNTTIERMFQQIAEQKLALEASFRTKNHFLQNLGQELTTPLQYLQGALGILGERPNGKTDHPDGDQWLTLMRDATRQLATHVDAVLTMADVDGTGMTVQGVHFDPARACNDVIDLYRRRAAARGHTLEVSVVSAGVRAHADRGRFLFSLAQILDNAVRYSPALGHIQVRLDTDLMQAGWITVQIINNGASVDPDVLRTALNPMEAIAGAMRSDTGMGLYLARRNMRLNGGAMSIQHPLSGGLHVDLHLPIDLKANAARTH